MGIFDKVFLTSGAFAPLLDAAPRRRFISRDYVTPGRAAIWAVGASVVAREVIGIACGEKGPTYCAWPLWWCAAQRPILLIKRIGQDFSTTVDAWDMLLFQHGVSRPGLPRGTREEKWEAHGYYAMNTNLLRNGKPILDGRYKTTYLWLTV